MPANSFLLGWARLLAGVAVVALVVVGSGAATNAPKPPRIVSAVMLDFDRDAIADGIRIGFSKPIRHVRDTDGRYPFIVAGYRIRRVGAASGRR